MIIGESFLWLHFPKCAGTTISFVLLKNFVTDASISFDETGHGDPIWHDTVEEREQRNGISLKDKDVIANIRRLPAYVVSKIKYSESLNSDIQHTKEHLQTGQFIEANGNSSSADLLIKHYDAQKVSHWLRTEYLERDFIAVFSKYLDLTGKDLSALAEQINSNSYNRDLLEWFSRDEMVSLYSANPLWAELERRVYGNLLYEEIY